MHAKHRQIVVRLVILIGDFLCCVVVSACFLLSEFSTVSGQNPTGQNPTGQNPYGQNPTGHNPTGQNPTT